MHEELVKKMSDVVNLLSATKMLSTADLDMILDCAHGKHDAIVSALRTFIRSMVFYLHDDDITYLFTHFRDTYIKYHSRTTLGIIVMLAREGSYRPNVDILGRSVDLLWALALDPSSDESNVNFIAHQLLELLPSHSPVDRRTAFAERCIAALAHPKSTFAAVSILQVFIAREINAVHGLSHPFFSACRNSDIMKVMAENFAAYLKGCSGAAHKDHVEEINLRAGFVSFLTRHPQFLISLPEIAQLWEAIVGTAVTDVEVARAVEVVRILLSKCRDGANADVIEFVDKKVCAIAPSAAKACIHSFTEMVSNFLMCAC